MKTEEIFTKGVEQLVNPITVGSMHFIQDYNRMFPRYIQDRLMMSSVKKYPYMGFVVEPYSYFLCHEIVDLKLAQALLPQGFKLIKTRIFAADEPKYYVIFGCVRAHTSAFWGSRMEFYVIAEDEKTGLLSWVIIDYDSNTISHDPKRGLRSASSEQAVITVSYNGNLYVDLQNPETGRKLIFNSNIENGSMTKLDQRLWLEGNLSICYGRDLTVGKAQPFSLKFDPLEVEKAWRIPLKNLTIEANNWFPGLYNPEPKQLVCFPYAQHYISDSPGHTSTLKNGADLEKALQEVEFDKIKVFSLKSLKGMLFIGLGISSLVTLLLVILLILK